MAKATTRAERHESARRQTTAQTAHPQNQSALPDVSLSRDGSTVTVHIPISLYRKPTRKLVIAPTGSSWAPKPARPDNSLVKALARAFRWRKLLETRVYGTIEEMAKAESINTSYVSRVLRLGLLSPAIVEAGLNGDLGQLDQSVVDRNRIKLGPSKAPLFQLKSKISLSVSEVPPASMIPGRSPT